MPSAVVGLLVSVSFVAGFAMALYYVAIRDMIGPEE